MNMTVVSVLIWVLMIWIMGLNLAICRRRVADALKSATQAADIATQSQAQFREMRDMFDRMHGSFNSMKATADGWRARCEFFTAICARHPEIAALVVAASKPSDSDQRWCPHVGGFGPPFPFCSLCRSASEALTDGR